MRWSHFGMPVRGAKRRFAWVVIATIAVEIFFMLMIYRDFVNHIHPHYQPLPSGITAVLEIIWGLFGIWALVFAPYALPALLFLVNSIHEPQSKGVEITLGSMVATLCLLGAVVKYKGFLGHPDSVLAGIDVGVALVALFAVLPAMRKTAPLGDQPQARTPILATIITTVCASVFSILVIYWFGAVE